MVLEEYNTTDQALVTSPESGANTNIDAGDPTGPSRTGVADNPGATNLSATNYQNC